MNKFGLILFVLTYSLLTHAQPSSKERDCYISGYLKSMFEQNYSISSNVFWVKDGVVVIDKTKLDGADTALVMEKTKFALKNIRFVKKIIWAEDSTPRFDNLTCYNGNLEKADIPTNGISIAPGTLFKPLMADGEWPRFTLAYQYMVRDKYIKHAFAPNFGASFSVYKSTDHEFQKSWEVGIMAGLFAIMDVGASASALMNADYYVALPITYKHNDFSVITRIYHLSSHLGDEFMLTTEGKKVKRLNLSYEGISAIASKEFNNIRIYGGGGYILHKDPGYIKPLMVQLGVEYTSSNSYWHGNIRPVAGIDIKAKEFSKWYPGVSVKWGVQLENEIISERKMQLLIEYYNGKSQHGQFYNNKVQSIGIALHAFL